MERLIGTAKAAHHKATWYGCGSFAGAKKPRRSESHRGNAARCRYDNEHSVLRLDLRRGGSIGASELP